MIKLRPFDSCAGKTHVLEHHQKTDENCDHANQTVVFRREQTRQNDGSCGAEQKLADLGGECNRAASRRTAAEITFQVIGAKVAAVVVTG